MFEVGQRVRRIRDVTGRYPVGTISTVNWVSFNGEHIKTNFYLQGNTWRADKFELVENEPVVEGADQRVVFYTLIYKPDPAAIRCIKGFETETAFRVFKNRTLREGGIILGEKKITLSNVRNGYND